MNGGSSSGSQEQRLPPPAAPSPLAAAKAKGMARVAPLCLPPLPPEGRRSVHQLRRLAQDAAVNTQTTPPQPEAPPPPSAAQPDDGSSTAAEVCNGSPASAETSAAKPGEHKSGAVRDTPQQAAAAGVGTDSPTATEAEPAPGPPSLAALAAAAAPAQPQQPCASQQTGAKAPTVRDQAAVAAPAAPVVAALLAAEAAALLDPPLSAGRHGADHPAEPAADSAAPAATGPGGEGLLHPESAMLALEAPPPPKHEVSQTSTETNHMVYASLEADCINPIQVRQEAVECALADSGLPAVLQAAASSPADDGKAESAPATPCAAVDAEAQHTGPPYEQAAVPVAPISAASDGAGRPAAVGPSNAGQPAAGQQEHADGHTLEVTDSMTAPAAEPDSSSALQLSSQGPGVRPQSGSPAAAASELRQPLGQSRRLEPTAANADGRSAQHRGTLPAASRVPALPAPPLMLHSQQPAPQPQGSGLAGAAEKRPSLHERGLPPAKRPKSSGPVHPAGSDGSSSGDPAAAAAVGPGSLIIVPQDSQLASGRCGQGTRFWTRSVWLWGVCLWPSPHQYCSDGSLCWGMGHLDLAVPV